MQGARQVRERLPDAKLIFIEPPSFEDLEQRLAARASDQPDQIERRLAAARDGAERRRGVRSPHRERRPGPRPD